MTRKAFPQDPAARDDYRAVGGTPAADADDTPCAVETAAACATTAWPRGPARLFRVGFVSARGPVGLNRSWRIPGTGQRFFVVADAAAGAAGLRARYARAGRDGEAGAEEDNFGPA